MNFGVGPNYLIHFIGNANQFLSEFALKSSFLMAKMLF